MAKKTYTVDLSEPIHDIITDGERAGEMEPISKEKDGYGRYRESLAKSFAFALRASAEGDAVKWLDDSIELVRSGKLVLDEADYNMYFAYAKNARGVTVLVRRQLISAFEKARLETAKAANTKEAPPEE